MEKSLRRGGGGERRGHERRLEESREGKQALLRMGSASRKRRPVQDSEGRVQLGSGDANT